MEDKFDGFDVILMHGPPFVGKERFCKETIPSTHTVICPKKIYQENSKCGLRDVAIEAYKKLKEGHKVVILDTNECRKTRESYVRVLKKKFDSLNVATVSIHPQYGCQQLFWSREFYMAQESLLEINENKACNDDEQILKWFEKSSDISVSYKYGTVDAVKDTEGSTIHQQVQGLQVTSTYKFEVPALFVQWECLTNLLNGDEKFLSKIVEVFSHWAEENSCGRLIVICDGAQIRTGERSRSQQASDIQEVMQLISASFSRCPLYVYLIEKPVKAGSYVISPNPGILAYLQRRHCLDLASKHTAYLYDTNPHMKMAENAGVRYVKASRLWDHPSLVTSSHIAVIPPIPDMLKHLTLRPECQLQSYASVPLYNKVDKFADGRIQASLGYGRCEFLFARDWDTVERYQHTYTSKATKVGEQGSAMSPIKSIKESHRTSSVAITTKSTHNTGSRELPKWMLSREESDTFKSSGDFLSGSTSSIDKKVRKSVYVMTEKELVEIATEILKEAGKLEAVEKLKIDQTTIKTPQSNLNIRQRVKRKPMENVHTDKSENLSSFCPKMECDYNDDDDDNQAFAMPHIDLSVSPAKKTKFTNTSSPSCEGRTKKTSDSLSRRKELRNDRKELDLSSRSDERSKTERDMLGEMIDSENTCNKKETHSIRQTNKPVPVSKMDISVLDDLIETTELRKPSPMKTVLKGLPSAKSTISGIRNCDSPKQGTSKTYQEPQTTKHDETRTTPKKRKNVRQNPDLSILDDIFL